MLLDSTLLQRCSIPRREADAPGSSVRWGPLRTRQSRVIASTPTGRTGAQDFWPAPPRPALGTAVRARPWHACGLTWHIACVWVAWWRSRAGVYTKMCNPSWLSLAPAHPPVHSCCATYWAAVAPSFSCSAPGPLGLGRARRRGESASSSFSSCAGLQLSNRASSSVIYVPYLFAAAVTPACCQSHQGGSQAFIPKGALDQLEPAPRQHLTGTLLSGSWLRSEESAVRLSGKHGVFLKVCCAEQRLQQ